MTTFFTSPFLPLCMALICFLFPTISHQHNTLLGSVHDLIINAKSSTPFMFCTCNLIIVAILLGSRGPSYGESDMPTLLSVYEVSIPTTNQETEKPVDSVDSDDLIAGYDVDVDVDVDDDGYNEDDDDDDGDDDDNYYYNDDDDDNHDEEEEDELRKRADEFIAKITKGWQVEIEREAHINVAEKF